MQFGTHGILEKHGFARNRFWAIDDNPPPFPTSTAAKAFVDLILKTSEEDLKIWPHRFVLSSLCFVPFFVCMLVSIPYFSSCFFEQIMACSFEFRLRVALGPGGDLALTSRIRNTNTDGRPFSFTFAYHTYFSVSDIRCVCCIQLPLFCYRFIHFQYETYLRLQNWKSGVLLCKTFGGILLNFTCWVFSKGS
jgi:glucose-6-phosphate 1-epimerase